MVTMLGHRELIQRFFSHQEDNRRNRFGWPAALQPRWTDRMRLSRFLVTFFICLAANGTANAQDESTRYKTGQIKVGDHILASPLAYGEGDACVITGIRDTSGWRPGYDGDFLIRCEHNGMTSGQATGDHVKFVSSGAVAAPPATPRPPVVPNAPPPTVAAPAGLPAPPDARIAATPTPTPPAAPAPRGGNAFGTRDPLPCPRVTGTPSTAQAAQLVKCLREGQSRENAEYLMDYVVVTSMKGSIYDRRVQTGFTNMDTTVAPIAIQGSLLAWMCVPQSSPTMIAKFSNVGQNCSKQLERAARGYCYRKRTGDWACEMNDNNIAQTDKQYQLPPPR